MRFTGGGLLFNIDRIDAQWRALTPDLAVKQGAFHRFCLGAPLQTELGQRSQTGNLGSTVWRVDFEKASCFQWFECLLGCCNGTFRRSGY